MKKLGYALKHAFGTIDDPGTCLSTLWVFLSLNAVFGMALYKGRPLFEHVEDFGLFALYVLCIVHMYLALRAHIVRST